MVEWTYVADVGAESMVLARIIPGSSVSGT